MDPDQPSNTSDVLGNVTPANPPVVRMRPINQSPLNRVYSHPQFQPQHMSQFQPQPQFQPMPQDQPQFNSMPQFMPQQQTSPSQLAIIPVSTQPSINYSDMICGAIRDLNEPDGSSELKITRHIQGTNPVLPPNHVALVTYHLRTLMKNGALTMVNKLYKLAAAPQSVAVAADLVAPRSPIDTSPLALLAESAGLASASASQPQKRGRGRPPKAKPEAPQEQQPINVQPIAVMFRGQSSREQSELSVTSPNHVVTESANRRGRPRTDGAAPNVPTAILALQAPSTAAVMQRGMKRGPGRPPKFSGGMNRPRKSATPMSTSATTETLESAYGELRRKLNSACEKAKEILDLLKSGIERDAVEVMSQARQEVSDGLIPILTVELHAVEEVEEQAVEQPEAMEAMQPREAAAQKEAETQGEDHGQEEALI